ncbi:YesL family protein [Pygmaiobacter massiliensis]|uniref:YesL family protein n=1 Tax=Pygmaiobacter massiliensis TaxID=1917873 RepID=UPI0015E14C51|nr:DUF624 domain-containing protein [Pygmaiobacter massiliensis]
MIPLFNPENKFWSFIGKLADLVCLSLLWVCTSLPVFTIGATITAFYNFTIHQVNDTESTVWHGFFTAFRKCFKKATCLWGIQLIGTAFLVCDFWLAWQYYLSHNEGFGALLILSVICCVSFIFFSCFFYTYPLLAIFDFPLKKLLSHSFIMAMGNLPVTITLWVCWGLCSVGIYYLSGVFFVWIGLAIFISSYFLFGVFKKYTGELTEEQTLHARRKKRCKEQEVI